jgi:DNA polymerase-3 subunit alpha
MAIVELEDLTGAMELVAFPDTFERTIELWNNDAILMIEAKLDRRNESLQLICESATDELPVGTPSPALRRTITVRLPRTSDVWADIQVMHRLDSVFQRHEGDDQLILRLPRKRGSDVLLRCDMRSLEWSSLLAAELSEVLGPDAVHVEEPALLELAS